VREALAAEMDEQQQRRATVLLLDASGCGASIGRVLPHSSHLSRSDSATTDLPRLLPSALASVEQRSPSVRRARNRSGRQASVPGNAVLPCAVSTPTGCCRHA
jgi:hypothetical protein